MHVWILKIILVDTICVCPEAKQFTCANILRLLFSEPKAEEEPPAKLLDDLFRKTKATPCIYWLPLTEEQVVYLLLLLLVLLFCLKEKQFPYLTLRGLAQHTGCSDECLMQGA